MIGKIFKYTVNTLLVALVLIGVLVVFSFIPFPGNYKVFTVMSGSMSPAIHAGSLIFVKPLADYNVGDVITRRTRDPKITITHRIVSKEEINSPQLGPPRLGEAGEAGGKIAFETKGDANDAPDGEKFTKEGIVGKAFISVPLLGYPVSYAKTTPGLILLIIIPAVIIIYDEMQKIRNEIRKKMDYKKRIEKRNENLDKDYEEKKEI
ncbi:MAG: signal peptidase I [Candidatus Moranbacteria bacterium]|nr:signal peptidase I [Candidatus Moranbacteria bacterium]